LEIQIGVKDNSGLAKWNGDGGALPVASLLERTLVAAFLLHAFNDKSPGR
jgi:hypothetical protein